MSNVIELFPMNKAPFQIWKPYTPLLLPNGYRVVKSIDGYYSQRRCLGFLWFDPLFYFEHYHRDYDDAVNACWFEHQLRSRL